MKSRFSFFRCFDIQQGVSCSSTRWRPLRVFTSPKLRTLLVNLPHVPTWLRRSNWSKVFLYLTEECKGECIRRRSLLGPVTFHTTVTIMKCREISWQLKLTRGAHGAPAGVASMRSANDRHAVSVGLCSTWASISLRNVTNLVLRPFVTCYSRRFFMDMDFKVLVDVSSIRSLTCHLL